jgi:acetyl esterase/lipase
MGNTADGTVQLDIKPAIEFFFAHDPGRYGADEKLGVIAFGGSSGAHNAYLLSITGVPGHRIWAAVGWSGLPDVALAGTYPESVFDKYMRTTPGTDVEAFGDPEHRINASSPPQYVANGTREFISPANAEQYVTTCRNLGVAACWERILSTGAHASGYARYTFTGSAPEVTAPPAAPGTTVLADSIGFANKILAWKSRMRCTVRAQSTLCGRP